MCELLVLSTLITSLLRRLIRSTLLHNRLPSISIKLMLAPRILTGKARNAAVVSSHAPNDGVAVPNYVAQSPPSSRIAIGDLGDEVQWFLTGVVAERDLNVSIRTFRLSRSAEFITYKARDGCRGEDHSGWICQYATCLSQRRTYHCQC